jgi:glucokinase
VLPTEIGNSSFAIQDLFSEFNLQDKEHFNVIEDLISGGGLAKIYSHFADTDKSPEEIVASYHFDKSAQMSVDIFLKSLAQILSELALAYMPGRGIYLAGGLVRSLREFLDEEAFIKNFLLNRKSMHADVLKQMPIALINQEMTCLHGSLNFINKISQNLN